MPADGFDAAVKKLGASARPAGSSQRHWVETYISGKDVERGVAVNHPYRGIENLSFRKVSVAEFQNPGADTGSQPLNESPAQRAGFLFCWFHPQRSTIDET
jgi:hypothetical protein